MYEVVHTSQWQGPPQSVAYREVEGDGAAAKQGRESIVPRFTQKTRLITFEVCVCCAEHTDIVQSMTIPCLTKKQVMRRLPTKLVNRYFLRDVSRRRGS